MKKTTLSSMVLPAVIILSFALLSSCGSSYSGKSRSSGKTAVILVVTNDKDQWEGDIGQTIKSFFGQEMAGLPQPEPMFSFYHIPSKNLDKIYRKFHNIFIVDINPDWKQVQVESRKDLWAWPQHVIKITAPTEEAFMEKFDEQKEAYLELYDELEKERILESFKMANDISISKKLEDKYKLFLAIPGGFRIAEEKKDFIWLRHTVARVKQGVELSIMVYFQEYTDTLDFAPDSIIMRRARITRVSVHVPVEGSWMKVADTFVKPSFSYYGGLPVDYVIETRGLWDLENDFMGGPFLSYTFVDEKTNRLVTLDGYLYYPNSA